MKAAIQGISFSPDGGFDITYAEDNDFHPKGVIVRQLMVPGGVVVQAVEEVKEAIRELLDLALVERYGDPDRLVRH